MIPFSAAPKNLYCKFSVVDNYRTCSINETIDSDDYVIGSPFNATIEIFSVSDNKAAKHLPRNISEKFPFLKNIRAQNCDLTVVLKFNFKNMRNLRFLRLSSNKIRTIESGSFTDLINVERLWLRNNQLETIDEKLLVSMKKLELVDLVYNKIKFLSPETFKIPGGQLELIDLQVNVCINEIYGSDKYGRENLEQVEADLRKNCMG